jgi:hypothetical protein
MEDNDPILRDLETALEYGAGTDEVWVIPADAVITPGTGPNIWHGLTITHWSTDA